MLVNDNEISKRLNNPLNLINRLAIARNNSRKNAMSLFIPKGNNNENSNNSKTFKNPFGSTKEKEPAPKIAVASESIRTPEVLPASGINPTIDELVNQADDKIGLATAHDKSLTLLNNAIVTMSAKLDDIKPEKLPAVIMATSKVVESIRRERLERERDSIDESIHFHFYVPKQKSIESYDVVNVTT